MEKNIIQKKNIQNMVASTFFIIGVGFIFGLLAIASKEAWVEIPGFRILIPFTVLFGVFIAQMLAKHLACCDHGHAPTKEDKVFLLSVSVLSLIHTFFDGTLLALTSHDSFRAEGIVLLTMVLHEILRFSLLYGVLSSMKFSKRISVLSTILPSLFGFGIGFLFSQFGINLGEGSVFHQYSLYVVIFLYSLIGTDIYLWIEKKYFSYVSKNILYLFFLVGMIISVVLESTH